MKLENLVNEISEKLFGYREASEDAILDRIAYLLDVEKNKDAAEQAKGERVRNALEELTQAIDGL